MCSACHQEIRSIRFIENKISSSPTSTKPLSTGHEDIGTASLPPLQCSVSLLVYMCATCFATCLSFPALPRGYLFVSLEKHLRDMKIRWLDVWRSLSFP